MKHLGDFDISTIVYGKFSTYRPSTGAAFTLGGTPALSVYKDGSTTQSTTGVTLTADFDSVTGLNHYSIDTSADGTFYSAGSNFEIVITTGTVDGVSVVGAVVAAFSLRKVMSKANLVEINSSTAGIAAMSRAVDAIAYGTVTTGSTTTVIAFSSLTPAASTSKLNGRVLLFPNSTTTANLRSQGGVISACDATTITLSTALTNAPASGDIFVIQ